MNDVQKHLLLNHLPIILPIVGGLILLVALLRKSELLQKTGLIVLIISAILTFPAFETGEHAEDPVEELGFSHEAIHDHEEHAETFAIFSYASGILALGGFFLLWKQHRLARPVVVLAFLSVVPTFFLGAQTGHSGGKIRRPDLENPASPSHEEKESGSEKSDSGKNPGTSPVQWPV